MKFISPSVLSSVFVCIMALSLAGCNTEERVKSPIADIVKDFELKRKNAMQIYGLSTASTETSISGTDCLVFNEAVKKGIPQDLGTLSALADSTYYRFALGCGQPVQTLADYETVRRVLRTQWKTQIDNLPYTSQILLQESPMGRLIQNRITEMVTEETVCIAEAGYASQGSKSSKNINKNISGCERNRSGRNREMQCHNSRVVASVLNGAQGSKDDFATLSELASRWRLAFNYCSPNDLQTYVSFHSTVRPDLFQAAAYRFTIPVDAVMQCSLTEMYNKEQKSKNPIIRPYREWLECGTKLYPNFGRIYSYEKIPDVFNKSIILGKDETNFMFNPMEIAKNPQKWELKDCERSVMNEMAQNRLNILTPYALQRLCIQKAHRQGTKVDSLKHQ